VRDLGVSIAWRVAFFLLTLYLANDAEKAKHDILRARLDTALTTDKKFVALYLAVIGIFVDQIHLDLKELDAHHKFLQRPVEQRAPYRGHASPHLFNISYAAKWVPGPEKASDKQLFFATALAHMVYPEQDTVMARRKLQAHILTPLRASQNIPEGKMSQGQWNIDYTKVCGYMCWRVVC
jgi:hypothetical protein